VRDRTPSERLHADISVEERGPLLVVQELERVAGIAGGQALVGGLL
jgi:hypothetical protein